jgi:hypothetical protein
MKTIGLLLVLSAGAVWAGTGSIPPNGVNLVPYYDQVPRIPQPIMQGIKDLAVRVYPSQPKHQTEAISDGVRAYLALQRIPNTPAKERAAEDFPFNYPKQLFLAQRPFQN